ncbi:hypothetical protein [Rhodalgimonas zhirmunskyi]|uniref:Uncharacterized protein n=1 Tax=Rhodalgimonas zhirmunskyi TaxID=2964767 RepID=A0AAJ1X6H6_9RHOB|nr:hypothetical protein [Rhodoalgimonas zhirmunskyi]MDQ2095224.1 hypothetical protein [Rhodoalgimonas zhirmunskyi]
MSQVEELERRITAALDRIGRGLDTLGPVSEENDAEAAAPDNTEIDALKQALEDEKLVSAQLEERIRALHQKNDSKLEELARKGAEQAETMARLDGELQRLRAANEQLRTSNAALREANEKGVGEPHLINKAMLAELEGLRAARAADRAETDAILGALAPLLQEESA